MNWLKQLFSRRRLYSDLSDEIHGHLDEKIEELVATGMSRKDATAAARCEFGNVALIQENSREVWRWSSIEKLVADLRFGLREFADRLRNHVLIGCPCRKFNRAGS